MPANSERWSRLLRSTSPDLAQDEILRLLGQGGAALPLAPEELLDIWRQARREISRVEAGLAARSSELDLLQSLGRRAAEAGWAEELFDATASVLHEGQALDLVLVGYQLDDSPRMTGFLARPFSDDYLGILVRRAEKFLGWEAGRAAVERRELQMFDEARGARDDFREEDLILLPVVRQGRPVACLLVVPSGSPDEGRMRVLYSASNQLSLHLDRILTVREAEADRFRSIVDSMPQGVVLTDARLRVLQANRSARSMLEAANVPGVDDLEPFVRHYELEAAVERVRGACAPLAEGEVRIDEERVWIVTVSPVHDPKGAVEGLVLVLTDVSERRRLRDQLTQAEKMSSLGRMISGVAHELNNPLASIVGYAQLIDPASGDEKLAERLQILRREAERCRKIVENLLSFARRREPEILSLSLNEVVRNVVTLLEYQLRVDDVGVETELGRDVPALRGDAHQLEQVLVNLLTNARHAIGKSGRPGTVFISTRRAASGTVVLEVRDDGPGIPDAVRSRIFDPFFTTKPAGEGTGLGLSLVYGIVAAHGGTIEVHQPPEGGTLFRLTFHVGDVSRTEPVREGPVAEEVARRGRILVVDDEDPVARLICEALAEDGHLTERANDGRQALDRLAGGEFDLIISDVKMPGMDGEQLGRELARRAPDLSGRLLLTTGDTLGDGPLDSRAPARHHVLQKPFDLDELRRVVRERLGPNDA